MSNFLRGCREGEGRRRQVRRLYSPIVDISSKVDLHAAGPWERATAGDLLAARATDWATGPL